MDPIVQTYTVDASPERVFRALTEADELERWWVTRAESEAEAGGRFRYVWEFEDPDKDGRQDGRYLEVTAPRRVRYPWDTGGVQTEVVFEVEASDAGTQLTLRHDGWPDGMGEIRERIADAWQMFLGNLRSVLEDGEDRRADLAGQKVR